MMIGECELPLWVSGVDGIKKKGNCHIPKGWGDPEKQENGSVNQDLDRDSRTNEILSGGKHIVNGQGFTPLELERSILLGEEYHSLNKKQKFFTFQQKRCMLLDALHTSKNTLWMIFFYLI